jgi:glycosyltransferase involved in cell wall biosynthesis
MRVLIDDGLTLGTSGGIGSHTEELVRRLTTLSLHGATDARVGNVSVRGTRLLRLLPHTLSRAAYQAAMQTCFPVIDRVCRYDIVHFASFYAPAWKLPGARQVVTIHDLLGWEMPALGDLPGWFWPYARWAVGRGIHSSDAVIVRTPSTGRRLVTRFNVPGEQVHVCPDGIKDVYIGPAPATDKREPLLLFVGTLVRRKNPETAVRAFAALASRFPELKLVIVGRAGSASLEVEQAIKENQAAGRIEVLHGLADTDLAALYRRASLLVMPSFYEGFGIPIIEAMASGLPVVASDIEVFREVGGDAVAYYGKPDDAAALASTITALLGDGPRRVRMATAGTELSKQFHWDKIVRRYLEIYEAVLSEPRRNA